MGDVNWMNAGTEADRIERAIRWNKLVNFSKYYSNPLFTNAAFTPWVRWYEAGQDWLAGPLMAAKFRERQASVFHQRKDR